MFYLFINFLLFLNEITKVYVSGTLIEPNKLSVGRKSTKIPMLSSFANLRRKCFVLRESWFNVVLRYTLQYSITVGKIL